MRAFNPSHYECVFDVCLVLRGNVGEEGKFSLLVRALKLIFSVTALSIDKFVISSFGGNHARNMFNHCESDK